MKIKTCDILKVLRRVLTSMVPVKNRNFLTTQIRSNPDLYGMLGFLYFCGNVVLAADL